MLGLYRKNPLMIKTSITSSKIHVNDGKIPRNANAKPRNPPNPNKKNQNCWVYYSWELSHKSHRELVILKS